MAVGDSQNNSVDYFRTTAENVFYCFFNIERLKLNKYPGCNSPRVQRLSIDAKHKHLIKMIRRSAEVRLVDLERERLETADLRGAGAPR